MNNNEEETFTEEDEALEISSMSPSEKQDILADMYGQIHPDETPEMIATGLSELRIELSKIPNKESEAYQRASRICPDVMNESHKLMFLRCEVFNADLAAARLVKYWKKRLELFGEAKAFRPLTLVNAYGNDDVALKIGYLQILSSKDNTGRAVVLMEPKKLDETKYSRESLVRAVWYIFHTALEETTAQQKGVVILGNLKDVHISQIDKKQMRMNLDSIKGCLPVRLSAIHMVHPPSFLKVIFPFMKVLLGARLRKRIKIYNGSDEETVKSLEKFGLTTEHLPVELGGKVCLDLGAWIDERRSLFL